MLTGYNFMFSPNAINGNIGYGYGGQAVYGSIFNYAWVIWIR